MNDHHDNNIAIFEINMIDYKYANFNEFLQSLSFDEFISFDDFNRDSMHDNASFAIAMNMHHNMKFDDACDDAFNRCIELINDEIAYAHHLYSTSIIDIDELNAFIIYANDIKFNDIDDMIIQLNNALFN